MKATKTHILFVILALFVSSCTQNHGHIGRLFGSWYLYEMTCDGDPVDIAQYGDTFWSFQSNLFMVTNESDYHTLRKSYGTWVESGNSLIIDFSYTYDYIPGQDNTSYNPPEWMGLPKAAGIMLQYMDKADNKMSFRYTDAQGRVFEYFLKKTY